MSSAPSLRGARIYSRLLALFTNPRSHELWALRIEMLFPMSKDHGVWIFASAFMFFSFES